MRDAQPLGYARPDLVPAAQRMSALVILHRSAGVVLLLVALGVGSRSVPALADVIFTRTYVLGADRVSYVAPPGTYHRLARGASPAIGLGMLATLNLFSAQVLTVPRKRSFSVLVAIIDLAAVPVGTLLGISTLRVLSRPQVRQLYDDAAARQQD